MDDVTRESMKTFCLREVEGKTAAEAYVAALSSAAHLCDQVARERNKSRYAREAAKACGDLIWEVYERVRSEHIAKK